MSAEAHLSVERLALFLAGELPPADGEALELHLDACDSCRKLATETIRARQSEALATAKTVETDLSARLPVPVGEVVEGRYRIDRVIGLGGMGCVYEAHHLHLNQRVALKFMLPQFANDEGAVARFTREGRAAVRLQTDNVGRVLDLGRLASGVPYLVMELLQGETVEQRLRREGPFAPAVAVSVVRQALRALEEAHGLGIIHRDLKPANLFFARRSNGVEIVKVLDFGIAKSVDPEIESGLTSTGQKTILGSPNYMAPEQLVPGRPIDVRADLWAIGCTLYELIEGQPPFRSDDLVELMYAIQTRPFTPMARAGLPVALKQVIASCLEKNVELRVPSAADLAQRLEALTFEAPPANARTRWRWAVGATLAVTLGLALWFSTRPAAVPEPTPMQPEPGAPVRVPTPAEPHDTAAEKPAVTPSLTPAVEPPSPAPVPTDAGSPARPATPAPRVKPVAPPTRTGEPDEGPRDPMEERR